MQKAASQLSEKVEPKEEVPADNLNSKFQKLQEN